MSLREETLTKANELGWRYIYDMPYWIYLIRHRDSGMAYVGCTRRGIWTRIRMHIHAGPAVLRTSAIGRAIREHGIDAFDVSELAYVEGRETARLAERQFMRDLVTNTPKGYNCYIADDERPNDRARVSDAIERGKTLARPDFSLILSKAARA